MTVILEETRIGATFMPVHTYTSVETSRKHEADQHQKIHFSILAKVTSKLGLRVQKPVKLIFIREGVRHVSGDVFIT